MICPNCGKESNGAFCPDCGAALRPYPASDEKVLAVPETGSAASMNAPSRSEIAAAYRRVNPVESGSGPSRSEIVAAYRRVNPVESGSGPARSEIAAAYRRVNPVESGSGLSQTETETPYRPAASVQLSSRERQQRSRETLRRTVVSPTFLIAVITWTVSSVFNTITVIQLLGSDPLAYFGSMREALTWAIGIFNLLNYVMVVGLWIIYGAAAGRAAERIVTGLILIKVVTIIECVCICLLAGLLLFDFSRGIGFLLSSLLIGALVPDVILQVKVVRMLNAACDVVRTGAPGAVSPFVAVMSFIAAGIMTAQMIGSFRNMDLNRETIVSVLAQLGECVALVLFGVCIFQYQTAMRRARTNAVPGPM